MKRILLLLIAICILLASAACGTEVQANSPSTNPEIQKHFVEAYGIVKATDIKNITLEFQSPIISIDVKEGERVKAGQTLMVLDMKEISSQLETKGLELEAAENTVSRSKINTDLKKLQNDLKNAQGIYDRDKIELASKKNLLSTGSLSQSEFDSFKKSLENEKKAIDDILFSIETFRNSKSSENEQQSLQATRLESELEMLKGKLDNSFINGNTVVSNVGNGLVFDLGYLQGDIAGPQKKLLSLMNLDTLVVEANVPEEFIKDVKPGAEAIIVPVADKNRQYKGKVTYISGKADRNNGETLISVIISLENPDEFLLPDFNTDVRINIQE